MRGGWEWGEGTGALGGGGGRLLSVSRKGAGSFIIPDLHNRIPLGK